MSDPKKPDVPQAPGTNKKKSDTRIKIRIIAFGGIFSALILLATYFLMIPLPGGHGYIHLGDGVIFVAAMVMGPFAAIPAAIGSALSDLVASYSPYIPATLIIKGAMGGFAGWMLRRQVRKATKRMLPYILVFAVAEVFMVTGYFFYEWLLYTVQIAAANILSNMFQAISGVAIGAACVPAMLRFRKTAALPAPDTHREG